ncbi:MAG: matrixin family metalloprotease [Pseudomonadota bacterium]
MTALAPIDSAEAYKLRSGCGGTEKWDTSRPIQVRLLSESFFAMYNDKPGIHTAADIVQIDKDIKAVIAAYNSIPGTSLVLEHGPGITSDGDLDEPVKEDFGAQTIVIGFTRRTHANSPTAEAWGPGVMDNGGCTRTRAHLIFRKDVNWVFGPPATVDVDGRHFPPADGRSVSSPHSFLGILLHEMGHGLALSHPLSDYAIMAQSFNTWFRGEDHAIAPGLLPDDIAGIRALYGTGARSNHVDLSLTNSWVKTGEQRVNACSTEEATVATAQQDWLDAIAAGQVGKPSFLETAEALGDAVDALERCEDNRNAVQIENCRISSRADIWADKTDELAFCGVRDPGSSYPVVSDLVCPGAQVQVRYTLNNNAMDRDILAKMRLWWSGDPDLDVRGNRARELRSADLREFTIGGGKSALLGHVFQVPPDVAPGQNYYVFVRALPFDAQTGANLTRQDTNLWDNAIMVRSKIGIKTSGC